MTWRTLRIATILIIIQSLLFFPAPVSRAQDRPTESEIKQAQEAADLFLKRLEETGDFSYLIDEMYAGDFIERYLQEQIRDGEEPNSPSDITFVTGIRYKRDLLSKLLENAEHAEIAEHAGHRLKPSACSVHSACSAFSLLF